MQRPTPWTALVALAAIGGLFFSAFSTSDFVAHLDRQVHGIHCSFLPGIEASDATGSTGCHTTLMSPYSSVFRDSTWGGLPVSLPAMGVFAFILFFAGALPILKWQNERRATLFLVLATLLPVLTSLGMGYLSIVTLDAVCKLCIGIYASSLLAFVGALGQWRRASSSLPMEGQTPVGLGRLAVAFAAGVAFVAFPAAVYAASAPDFERYVGECGELDAMPSEGMLVALGPQDRDIGVVEVFDPLCPACRGFEERFDAQSASAEVSRQVLLFPLDDACNWMVDDAIHAGACAISEAILCADESDAVSVEDVVAWAFSEQESIREATEANARAAAARAREAFPALGSCIGSPQARARLNVGLRYAVENQMPIVTPQLFVNGVRMCDEDTDLGMDFILRRLIDKARVDGIRPPSPRGESLAAPTPPRPRRTRPSIELRPRRAPAPEVEEGSAADLEALAEAAGELSGDVNAAEGTAAEGTAEDTVEDGPEPAAPASDTEAPANEAPATEAAPAPAPAPAPVEETP